MYRSMIASVNSYYAQQLLCSIVRQTERIVDIDSVSHFAATASELPIGVLLRLNSTFIYYMNQSHNVKPKPKQNSTVNSLESRGPLGLGESFWTHQYVHVKYPNPLPALPHHSAVRRRHQQNTNRWKLVELKLCFRLVALGSVIPTTSFFFLVLGSVDFDINILVRK